MGGGGRYPFPKHVWSTTGGWWHNPVNWRQNTLTVVGITAIISIGFFIGDNKLITYNKEHDYESKYARFAEIAKQARENNK